MRLISLLFVTSMKSLVITLLLLIQIVPNSYKSHVVAVRVHLKQLPYRSLASFKGDTSKYLIENFVNHQHPYKNKELNVLLHRLEVPVKGYLANIGGDYVEKGEVMQCVAITFDFYDGREIDRKVSSKKEPAELIIFWKKPFSFENSVHLYRQFNNRYTDGVKRFYGKQIIDSISYIRYNFK